MYLSTDCLRPSDNYESAKVKWNPSDSKELIKDEDVMQMCGKFSYSIIIVILMYLADHNRPDIAYELNCSEIYIYGTRYYHKLELKRVGIYLKAIRDKGLMLNPSCYL